jgi:SAM-dependent methyltransferase
MSLRATRSSLLAACLCLSLSAQSAPADEQAWKHFFSWWSRQPAPTRNNLNTYREPYLQLLRIEGLSEQEAERRMEFIRRESFVRPEFTRALYDSRYTSDQPVFNPAPNAFVARIASGLKPGRALDVQMGQGRNALHLARLGWTVSGFDISGEGIRTAREAAARAGVTLDAVQSDHRAYDFGVEKWDLIVLSYPWIPFTDRATYAKILKSLKPGGSLVYEHFLRTDNTAEHVPYPNQLFREFGELHILFYEETRAAADWQNRQEATVVRLHATK